MEKYKNFAIKFAAALSWGLLVLMAIFGFVLPATELVGAARAIWSGSLNFRFPDNAPATAGFVTYITFIAGLAVAFANGLRLVWRHMWAAIREATEALHVCEEQAWPEPVARDQHEAAFAAALSPPAPSVAPGGWSLETCRQTIAAGTFRSAREFLVTGDFLMCALREQAHNLRSASATGCENLDETWEAIFSASQSMRAAYDVVAAREASIAASALMMPDRY